MFYPKGKMVEPETESKHEKINQQTRKLCKVILEDKEEKEHKSWKPLLLLKKECFNILHLMLHGP